MKQEIIARKLCSKCKIYKPLSEFNRKNASYRPECKDCQRIDRAKYTIKGKLRKVGIDDIEFQNIRMLQNKQFITFDLRIQQNLHNVQLDNLHKLLQDKLQRLITQAARIREMQVSVLVKYNMRDKNGQYFEYAIETLPRVVNNESESYFAAENLAFDVIDQIQNQNHHESGLSYENIVLVQAKITGHRQYRGSGKRCAEKICRSVRRRRRKNVTLPRFFKNRNSVWNPKCVTECFQRCAREFARRHKISKPLDFTGMRESVTLFDMRKFEENNNIIVNVFLLLTEQDDKYLISSGMDDDDALDYGMITFSDKTCPKGYMQYGDGLKLTFYRAYPRNSNQVCMEDQMNLLLYKKHYYLITNLRKFFKVKKFKCFNCFNEFRTQEVLNEHTFLCRSNRSGIHYTFPKGSLSFAGYTRSVECPFVIFADFETIQQTDGKHMPVAFSSLTICRSDSKHNKAETQVTFVANKAFVNYIIAELKRIKDIMLNDSNIVPIHTTKEEDKDFDNATQCYLCKQPFGTELRETKVKDHDHINGRYRGAAHNKCNLSYLRQKRFVPIVFHNLTNYDAHLFIKDLMNYGKVNVLAKSCEKFFTFTCDFYDQDLHGKIKAKFIDSYMFLPASLRKLTQTVQEFRYTDKSYANKLPFPYCYAKFYAMLLDAYEPNKDDFFDIITQQPIDDNSYANFVQVFNANKCKCLADYMKIYVANDVNILADVFETFRDRIQAEYGLDPANYYTIPGLAWDACLKMTGQTLQYLEDKESVDFIYEGIRGGICTCSELKYACANNAHTGLPIDDSIDKNYILFIDANNLYGHSMCQPLPIGDFQLRDDLCSDLSLAEIRKTNASNNYDIDNPNCIVQKNYILKVDLEYPLYLHKSHNSLPLAAERIHGKLIPNLFGKKDYVCYARNLLFYLDNGLILRKIHKVLEFKESNWLSKYIHFNTKKRQEASKNNDEFGMFLYKLMNNSVYGKTLENLNKRVYMRLVNDDKVGLKLCSRPNYKRFIEIDDTHHIIELTQRNVLFNKPIYLGMVILEISKLFMYDFHYNVMKKTVPCKLMYTDTDSFVYNIKLGNKGIFNWDDYPLLKQKIDFNNSLKLGLFKDEYPNNTILSFVCLKSKLYSIKLKDSVKCKGVPKTISDIDFTHDTYVKTLQTGMPKSISFLMFKSIRQEIRTIVSSKHCLDNNDDKRQQVDLYTTNALGYNDDADRYTIDKNDAK